MDTRSSAANWAPKEYAAGYADTTETIHRWIAWIYGVLGLLATVGVGYGSYREGGVAGLGLTLGIGAFFAFIVGLHAALAAGARRRSEAAKIGSMIVGTLMLLGFPIGTIVGGFLIYNGAHAWPPRRDPSMAPAGGVDMRDL